MTIFQINIGNVNYSKYSVPIMKKFCEFNKVNHFVLTYDPIQNKYHRPPSWIKLFAHEFIKDDFILYWDLDLVPLKLYDISPVLDYDKLNMVGDTSLLVENGFNSNFKFNTGLIGIPKNWSDRLIKIYESKAPLASYPSWEQYYVNDYISENNEKIHELPIEYNYMYNERGLLKMEDVKNLHFTWEFPNSKSKEEEIKKIYENF